MIHSNEAAMPALYASFALAQAGFDKIIKNTEVQIRPKDASKSPYKFRYADLDEILTKTRPALNANGLGLMQPVIPDEAGKSWLVTALTHKDGGALISRVAAPDPTDDPKVYGGLLSFMRRYMVSAMLGIAADSDIDDDGNAPGDDYRGYQDAARTPPAAAPPARRSAAAVGKPAAAAAAPTPTPTPKPAPAAERVGEGQLNNLLAKIKSLQMSDAMQAAMLAKVGVQAIDASMSLADWKKVKAELDAAARLV